MKKRVAIFMVSLVILIAPTVLSASEENSKTTASEIKSEEVAEAKTEIETMVDRVLEIKEMDRNELTRDERKELKNELRSIKKDLKTYSKSDSKAIAEAAAKGADRGGIYISGGALLVIIVLLILL